MGLNQMLYHVLNRCAS